MSPVRIVALWGVIGVGATVVALNVIGWPQTIPGLAGYIVATLALFLAVVAFTFWEVTQWLLREKEWLRAGGAALIFLFALAIDGAGVHFGLQILLEPWRAEMADAADTARREAQERLDADRRDRQAEIATLNERIGEPDLSKGPQNDASELAAWRERTSADVASRNQKQAELTAMPLTVSAAPVAPWLAPATWGIAALFEFVVAFGLFVLNIRIPGTEEKAEPKTSLRKDVLPATPTITPERPPAPEVVAPRPRPKVVSLRAMGEAARRIS